MSIEFGILRDGSTVTLMGEHRVDLDEELLPQLGSFFRRIELRTGQVLDTYGSASFSDTELDALIDELESSCTCASNVPIRVQTFLSDLLRVSRVAKRAGKPLSFMGL